MPPLLRLCVLLPKSFLLDLVSHLDFRRLVFFLQDFSATVFCALLVTRVFLVCPDELLDRKGVAETVVPLLGKLTGEAAAPISHDVTLHFPVLPGMGTPPLIRA